jgi:Mg2+/Co2+ transporter CorB
MVYLLKESTPREHKRLETSTTDLFKQALDLDERDRATLAGLLIESLEEKPDEGLEATWNAEVLRMPSENQNIGRSAEQFRFPL